MTTLREIVNNNKTSEFYTDNALEIEFELNHLELHYMDSYLLSMMKKGIVSSENEGNSHVAYLIGITTCAPTGSLKTSGGSFPDIDLDFEKERREEVRQHLVDKYGKDKVAAIGTFQFPKPKGLFKDVARMYDLDFTRSNQISKMIPDRPDLKYFSEALDESVELKELYDSDEEIKKIVDYAQKLEGTIRTIGVHACGMCISTEPITDIVPLFDSKGTNVTQFDGPTLEKIGLIKYDILGLKNLSTISKTQQLILKTQGHVVDVEKISLSEPEAYDLIASGNSLGVFQIEGSQGLRDFAATAKPESLDDLAAVISLYRPGPMGMGALEHYIARKHGHETPEFAIREYNYIFEDTYGLLVYQEQLMRLAADMCSFDDIETDELRKAVGKKDHDLLMAQKEKFVSGAVANGQNRQQISELFDEMEEFARYCFNKSHAVCYAKIGYQTAWLKANYPSEYMAALISTEEDSDQQSLYISDARRNFVEVMPPDINNSVRDFTVGSDGQILFGFNCIKGVGGRAVEKLLSIQPFDSIGDFLIKSHHAKGINKRVIESLIKCGACDVFGYKRSCMVAMFENFLVDYETETTKHFRENGMVPKDHPEGVRAIRDKFVESESHYFDRSDLVEYPLLRILDYEKELLGVNISGNPFDVVSRLIKEKHETIAELTARDHSAYLMGQVNKVKRITTKKGDAMAFFDMTDKNGDSRSFTIFPQQYAQVGSLLEEGRFLLTMVTSKTSDRGIDCLVTNIRDLTHEIEGAYQRAEERRGMKSIDVHTVGLIGSVRMNTLLRRIEQHVLDEDIGNTISLKCDIGKTVFTLNSWPCAQIDIAMLREFGKLPGVYVARGNER